MGAVPAAGNGVAVSAHDGDDGTAARIHHARMGATAVSAAGSLFGRGDDGAGIRSSRSLWEAAGASVDQFVVSSG